MERQTADAHGNAFDKDCALRRMGASLSAALTGPAPATARPPEVTPGPAAIRAIYDEVAAAL
eukprot:3433082-Alexandrium_andersonii.AAC.1